MKARIVFWKYRKNADGTCPILLRITDSGKPHYLSTGIVCRPEEWDKRNNCIKGGQKVAPINQRLVKLQQEADNVISSYILKGVHPTATMVLSSLKGEDSESFISFYEKRKNALARASTKNDYEKKIAVLKEFAPDLRFDDITVEWLNEFKTWLSKTRKDTTVYNHIKTLKAVYREGMRQDKTQSNPFFRFSIEKGKSKKREKLTVDEVKRIEGLNLKVNTRIWHVRNVFLFSIYCQGFRIADLLQLRWSNIIDGRVEYRMQKTGNEMSVRLNDKALAILDHYRNNDPIFPFIKKRKKSLFQEIKAGTALMNKHLGIIAESAEIQKNISTHVARNTVANRMRETKQNPSVISAALGHSDERTTKAYLNEWSTEQIDEATEGLF